MTVDGQDTTPPYIATDHLQVGLKVSTHIHSTCNKITYSETKKYICIAVTVPAAVIILGNT